MSLRVAVIGAGRLGGFHAQKLARMANVELVGVVDPLPANRDRLAAELHTSALASHLPLLGRLDAAVIASPTVLHHRLAVDFLEARTHLLVEKPICTTVAEADELVELARREQLVLQVGHVERFNPALAAAAPHVRDPKFIQAVRASNFTFRSMDVGVVLDLMIHDIDVVLSLVRSPLRSVDALGVAILGGHEDAAHARLEFQSGCVANLSASRVSYEPARKMQIWAPRAYANIDFNARTTTVVRPSDALLRGEFHADRLAPELVEHYKKHLAEEHLPRQQQTYDAVDALALELQDFVDSVLSARQPRVTGEAGRDALAVAEQILTSIANHAWDSASQPATGPAIPYPRIVTDRRVVPAPHFDVAAIERTKTERKAG
ncbi:MAG: Gfo/Idh/MocA family oxidoreductase [Thermoguttaceae bacterium]